ncbi:MAG TPA: RluA family pseudouridine synthase [Terriglobales bacterium]|nr:RluA family pseudouridine synthase [Terriglobales bacterium]
MTAAPATFVCADATAPRLDRFLAAQLPEWSRTRLQALIEVGAVRVNGAPASRASLALSQGARVEVDFPPPPPSELVPEPIPLNVLYEDEDLVAINKPAGLVVHPGAGRRTGTLVNALLHHFGTLSAHGGADRPGIVHRLDRGTSGVLVVARNDFAHQRLARQFHDRTVRKTYNALVHGLLPSKGNIDLPIGRDPRRRARMSTRRRVNSREAHTSYRVVRRFPEAAASPQPPQRLIYSWLEVALHTGRTHQIRVHLAALGHPIVGDKMYGAPALLAGPGTLAGTGAPRVMLHAARLELTHPRTGAALAFTAPLPAEITGFLQQLGPERYNQNGFS